jgi:hypothetical protein
MDSLVEDLTSVGSGAVSGGGKAAVAAVSTAPAGASSAGIVSGGVGVGVPAARRRPPSASGVDLNLSTRNKGVAMPAAGFGSMTSLMTSSPTMTRVNSHTRMARVASGSMLNPATPTGRLDSSGLMHTQRTTATAIGGDDDEDDGEAAAEDDQDSSNDESDADSDASNSVPIMGYVLSAFMVDNLIKNLRVRYMHSLAEPPASFLPFSRLAPT